MYPLINFISHDMGKTDINPPSRRGQKNTRYNRTYNNNNIFTFDTETTSLQWEGQKVSFVYIAALSINGVVWYMRDLNTFKTFLDKYNDNSTINVIYVHNLGFDFSFLSSYLDFDSVFARKAHKPIYARYKNWEFRCSYFLSQMSLANICSNYPIEHCKKVGDLDYRKRRHTGTELTETELDYLEFDCLSLHDYIKYMLEQNGGKYREMPYTQTGFVRRDLLQRAKDDGEYHDLRKWVYRTEPDIELFKTLECAYAGGYTHANFFAVTSGVYTKVHSFDFTSSYPAVMCRCNNFPMGKFRRKVANFDKYLYSEKYACVGKFKLKNLKSKTHLSYLSYHKICMESYTDVAGNIRRRKCAVNCVSNNGRIYSADEITIYLTSVDIDTVKMMYECDIEVFELWVADAGRLPKTIIKSILQWYSDKTQYKGIDEKQAVYLQSKQKVNSIYGCSVFNPYCDDVVYDDGEWLAVDATPEKLHKYFLNRKTILPYQVGVWVTALARNKLCKIASIIGNDVLYMDTDSIKYVGDYKHVFENDNKLIHDENVTACEELGLDFDMFAPSDTKGNVHELGLWDYEGCYKSFKVLGSKRYCYTRYGDSGIYPVVAGCPKQTMREYLMINNGNALLKNFELNTKLTENESGKNTVTYHDNLNIDIPVTDYLGNTKIEHIGAGAHIEKTSFDMSFADDYFKFLLGYGVSDKKVLIRNGVYVE